MVFRSDRPDLYNQYRALGKQGIQQREEDRGKQEAKRKARTQQR